MVRKKDRESKKEKDVRGEKKGEVREPSYTHQSVISKNDPPGSQDGVTHIWLLWIYLFSDTHTHIERHTHISTEKTKHIHLLSLHKTNFNQLPPGCLFKHI